MVAIFFGRNGSLKVNRVENMLDSNPGMGGTEYLILMLYYFLNLYYPELNCHLFSVDATLQGQNILYVKDIYEAIEKAKEMGVDEFVFVPKGHEKRIFEELRKHQINAFAWVHNYLYGDMITELEECENIRRIIFVSRQLYDAYIDSDMIHKATYIFNMVCEKKRQRIVAEQKKNVVTYIGALISAKGFHMLAAVWKDILTEVPDAELRVIGSGKLYSSGVVSGKYGIAEKKYEEKFMKYLTDVNGNILDSVKFLGTLGSDKEKVMKDTKVGVANPTGVSETFCLSAVEFKQYGVPVVTYRGHGLLDTIRNGVDGILIKGKRELKKGIVRLLKDNELNNEMGKNAYDSGCIEFQPRDIAAKWYELIKAYENAEAVEVQIPDTYMMDDIKWLKVVNYNLKSKYGIKARSIAFYTRKIKETSKKICNVKMLF